MAKSRDKRPAWGFFYDPKIGKVRPLCGRRTNKSRRKP